ncbi:tyrosine-protein phosphatase [Saccharopolyspora phatthalungensis]|uniref:Rhodanese-related sulfurtransferase n=1 Tax=Saccharopolyspora phatthalungensis TaxID=664693 RepID=A0A840Q8Y1_9PSEU|nr:tyrosine-protein phosphatase [Saccharopolyspora phatthalungensis]MBB5156290.1 rhodanese-related sulfurtransferase [Saccharopolyspora phatthalungensis]
MPTRNPLDALVNVRDLGGQPAGNGAVTRPGVVYRGDAPHTGDRCPQDMPRWPPAAVLDLRNSVETGDREHPLTAVATVHRVRLLEEVQEADVELDDAAHELTALYQSILQGAPKTLVEVFRLVLEADGPILIHCAAGKDRTGVVSAMLLSAVGVRRDAIMADYVRTDRNMFRVLQRLNVAPELPPGVDEEMVRDLMSTPTEAIESVLDAFADHEDGAQGWLRSHGATDEELRRWQQKFLV